MGRSRRGLYALANGAEGEDGKKDETENAVRE